MKANIKLMVADDHPAFLAGIKSLLQEYQMLEIVGEATNGKELLDLMKNRHADVILLDVRMPVMDGRQALSKIMKHYKDTKVIMLSFENSMGIIKEFLRAGASAFVSKSANADIYIKTILEVNEKGISISDEQSQALAYDNLNPSSPELFSASSLSPKELQVLSALCEGKTEKEISGLLSISVNTVHTHRNNIYKKTKVKKMVDLVLFAVKNSLIPTAGWRG